MFAGSIALVLAVLSHATALTNGFVYDDFPELDANPLIEAPFSLRSIFAAEYWSGFQGRFHTGYYRPIPLLVQKIVHDLFGRAPMPYHAVVVVLHGVLALLIAEFLRRRCGLRLGALVAGALFAVHTANSEAVACAYGLKEVLAGLLPFSALFVYSGWSESRPIERLVRLGAASGLLAGGLLSKESSIGLFVILPAWDLLRGAPARSVRGIVRESVRPAVLHGALFAASVFAAFTMRAPVVGGLFTSPPGSAANNPLLEEGLFPRLATALRVAWLSLRLLILPAYLSHDYSTGAIPVARSFLHLEVLAGLLALAGLAALLFRAPRLLLPAGVGAVFTASSYALSSNLLVVIGTLFSERFLYLPSIGLCLVAAPYAERGIERIVSRFPRRTPFAAAACAALLGALTLATVVRCRVYANEDWMIEDAYRHVPGNLSIQAEMAGLLQKRHDFASAERLLDEVERARPDLPFLTEQRARLLLAQGRHEEGMAHLAEAVRLPDADLSTFRDYAERLAAGGQVAEAVGVLSEGLRSAQGDYRERALVRELRGALLLHLGKTSQALLDLRLACLIYPSYGPAWADLTKGLASAGRDEEALAAGARALALNPSDREILSTLARLDTKRREMGSAADRYRRLLEIDPSDLAARSSLGGCLISLGDREGARVVYEQVLERAPNDRYALASLGSLEDSRGERGRARALYERFLATSQPDDDLTRKVKERLARLNGSPPGWPLTPGR